MTATFPQWLAAASDMLREHGASIAIGVSVLLLAGVLCTRACRAVVDRHRTARLALLGATAYLLFAAVPMPRVLGPRDASPAVAVMASTDERRGSISPPARTTRTAETEPATQGRPLPLEPRSSSEPSMPGAPLEPPIEDLEPATAPPFAWLQLVTALLALGATAFVVQLLLGAMHLRRVVRDSVEAPDALRQLVPLPPRTRLRITRQHVQPFCFGLLRPTIVLPRNLARASRETRFVLQHECAHLTSGDVRARLLAALLRPVLFWHPLFWWLCRELRYSGELLADDAAARMPDGGIAEYVRCMMNLSTRSDRAASTPLAATIFRRRSELFRRLETMLQRDDVHPRPHSTFGRRARAATAALLVAATAGTFGVRPATAQDPGDETQHRRQVQALRQEIAELRRELEALREQPSDDQLPEFYVVKPGDSLWTIARRNFGSRAGQTDDEPVARLRRLNPSVDGRKLAVGQKLRLRGEPASDPGVPAPRPRPHAGQRTETGLPRTDPFTSNPLAAEPAAKPPTDTPEHAPAHTSSLGGLADLVQRCYELQGDVRIQEVLVANAKGVDREIAAIRLHTKQQQYEAVRTMLDHEIEQAEAEYRHLKQLRTKGFVSDREAERAKHHLEMLQRVRK